MAWVTFGNAVSPEPTALLDQNFNNVMSGASIPCTAGGTNAISLTPTANFPSLSSYNDLGGYRFVAAATTTAAVTLQYNGLGFFPVYKADGVTQANVGDIVINEQYIATFHQALNGGLGGFFLESPSVSAVVNSSQFTPGGRLTFTSGVPVMFSTVTNQQIIYYAPYVHPLIAVYNGSIIQMVQFTSSLSDQVGLQLNMGGAAQWTANTNFDLFVTLVGATPTLVGVKWTNNTTRATTLSIFGGFLTNSGSCTAFTGPSTSITMPANQGTFVGTVQTSATQGTSFWIFGTSASGGGAASFNLCNYYNAVEFVTRITDNGGQYTYTSATVREARGSTGNQINFVQASSERALLFEYSNFLATVAVANADPLISMGLNTTTAFSAIPNGFCDAATANVYAVRAACVLQASFTGYGFLAALEAGDGTNANSFNASASTFEGTLSGRLWL